MKVFAIVLGLSVTTVVIADSVNKQLATVRKAFVLPVDDLGDDAGVAACFANHLHALTPVEVVKNKEEADVIFKVSAHLPSTTTKVLVGAMGGSPSAHLFAESPDGKKIWDDGAKYR